jgi:hypothetical protein
MTTRPAKGYRALGPSTSTEPGWMVASGAVAPCYLGVTGGCDHKRSSMLLSFERPVPAADIRQCFVPARNRRPAMSLFTVLENCTEATSAASISGG